MNKLPISVIILTYNDEDNIRECFESISDWIDEIFVVDSYSTDMTVNIAKQYTDKIYQHLFENYAKQRNWAQNNLPIRNEWVFHLDADESVTLDVIKELNNIFSQPVGSVDGFLVSRRTFFMGKWIKHGGHYPAYHLRIFKKNSGRCEDRLYDQHFYVQGNIKILKADIINIITSDLNRIRRIFKRWAVLEAVEEINKCMNYRTDSDMYVVKADHHGNPIEQKRWLREQYYKFPMFIRPFMYFFYRYFFKFGFLDGKEGLIFHILQGFWFRFLVDTKIYVIKKKIKTKSIILRDIINDM